MYIYIHIYLLPPHDLDVCVFLAWIVKGSMKTPQCSTNPKVLGHEVYKPCNARKIPKMPKFCDLWPSSLSLHSLQKFGIFGIFRAVQCLVHLVPQNFGIFGSLQCLVYLRATKHRNARKIPKFWGMRCTNPVMLERSQKNPNFVIYGPQACMVYKSLGVLGFYEQYSVWCTSCPKTLGFFGHYSVWCTSAPRNTAMLEKSQSFGA